MPESAPLTVALRGGLRVSVPALVLLLSLEQDGRDVVVRAGQLVVDPPIGNQSPRDLDVAAYRRELIALVRYCEGQL